MAKVNPSLIEQTGTIGDRVYYTRFGKQFSRGKAKSFTDKPISFHLYGIVEAANTACISTLSPDEKKADKSHRNINRRVSPSIFIGTITVDSVSFERPS